MSKRSREKRETPRGGYELAESREGLDHAFALAAAGETPPADAPAYPYLGPDDDEEAHDD